MRFAGVGLVILAAICWGISGGIGDILMNKGWDLSSFPFTEGLLLLYVF